MHMARRVNRRLVLSLVVAAALGLLVAGLPTIEQATAQAQPQNKTAAPAAQPAPAPAKATAPPAAAKAAAPAPAKAAAPPKPRFGPPYRELPIDPDLAKQRVEIARILRAGQLTADQQQTFTTYYQRYALARWTRLDHFDKLPQCRKDLRNELLMSGKPSRGNNSVHDRLIGMALPFMQNVARMNFPPASRFNAMLALGELNQREAAGLNKPPVPLPQALPILLDTLDDPNQLDAVKLAALIGIRRHCAIGVGDAQLLANRIVPALTKIVNTKDPQPPLSPQGQAWMRALAAETLATLGSIGDQGTVANSLRDLLGENKSPDFLRYTAAKSLGKLNYQGVAGLDASTFVYNLGLLAVNICDAQQQLLRQQERRDELKGTKSTPLGYGMGGGMEGMMGGGMEGAMGGGMESTMGGGGEGGYPAMEGGFGMGSRNPNAQRAQRRIEEARRRLKEGLGSVLVGLGKETTRSGVAPHGIEVLAASPQLRDLVGKISQPIHDCFTTIDEKEDDKQIDSEAFHQAVDLVRSSLAEAVATLGPVPEPPGTQPEADQQPAQPEGPASPPVAAADSQASQ